jgi:hypothetical protein
MDNSSLLTKVRSDSKAIMKKLSAFRNVNDVKNYKTTVDSLQMLIDINQKNTIKERFESYDDGKHYTRRNAHSDETVKFFEDMIFTLNDEINLIEIEMDKSLYMSDIRIYRDLLISYEKLTRVHQLLDGEYQESKEL